MGWGTFCHLCFNYFELLESFHSELEGSDGKHLKVLFSLEIGAFTFYQIRHDFATPGVAMMPRVHGLGISAKSNQGSLGRHVATGSAAGVNVAQICTHRFIDYKQILQKSSLAKVSLANFCQLPLVWIFLKILYSDIDMWVTWGSIFAAVLPHVPGTCIATQAQETFPAVGVDRREDAADKPQLGIPGCSKRDKLRVWRGTSRKKAPPYFFFPKENTSLHLAKMFQHMFGVAVSILYH